MAPLGSDAERDAMHQAVAYLQAVHEGRPVAELPAGKAVEALAAIALEHMAMAACLARKQAPEVGAAVSEMLATIMFTCVVDGLAVPPG